MFPRMNDKAMRQMMKRMGIQPQDIDAEEVIIKCKDKNIIIKNPQVSKINIMGQNTIQILGDIEEIELKRYTEEDIKTVMEQTKCKKEDAISSLEKNEGDLARSILYLQNLDN